MAKGSVRKKGKKWYYRFFPFFLTEPVAIIVLTPFDIGQSELMKCFLRVSIS